MATHIRGYNPFIVAESREIADKVITRTAESMHEQYTISRRSPHCITQWHGRLKGNFAAIIGDERLLLHISCCVDLLLLSLVFCMGDVEEGISELGTCVERSTSRLKTTNSE